MFPESLKYPSGAFMMESYVILGVDSHIIHVNFEPLLWEHVCKDVIHECLECGGSIAESEEHDGGFEQFHGGDEGRFPLVLFSDANVVISPMNVKFGEQGGFFHVIDEFGDQGERIGILDGVGVQIVVILAGT